MKPKCGDVNFVQAVSSGRPLPVAPATIGWLAWVTGVWSSVFITKFPSEHEARHNDKDREYLSDS